MRDQDREREVSHEPSEREHEHPRPERRRPGGLHPHQDREQPDAYVGEGRGERGRVDQAMQRALHEEAVPEMEKHAEDAYQDGA